MASASSRVGTEERERKEVSSGSGGKFGWLYGAGGGAVTEKAKVEKLVSVEIYSR